MKNTDPDRNQPTEKGKDKDPNLRDESAFQPGVNTASNSNYDDANQKLTRTAADDFRKTQDSHPNADPRFDEVDKED